MPATRDTDFAQEIIKVGMRKNLEAAVPGKSGSISLRATITRTEAGAFSAVLSGQMVRFSIDALEVLLQAMERPLRGTA